MRKKRETGDGTVELWSTHGVGEKSVASSPSAGIRFSRGLWCAGSIETPGNRGTRLAQACLHTVRYYYLVRI